jgi:hypothetical protein
VVGVFSQADSRVQIVVRFGINRHAAGQHFAQPAGDGPGRGIGPKDRRARIADRCPPVPRRSFACQITVMRDTDVVRSAALPARRDTQLCRRRSEAAASQKFLAGRSAPRLSTEAQRPAGASRRRAGPRFHRRL